MLLSEFQFHVCVCIYTTLPLALVCVQPPALLHLLVNEAKVGELDPAGPSGLLWSRSVPEIIIIIIE